MLFYLLCARVYFGLCPSGSAQDMNISILFSIRCSGYYFFIAQVCVAFINTSSCDTTDTMSCPHAANTPCYCSYQTSADKFSRCYSYRVSSLNQYSDKTRHNMVKRVNWRQICYNIIRCWKSKVTVVYCHHLVAGLIII